MLCSHSGFPCPVPSPLSRSASRNPNLHHFDLKIPPMCIKTHPRKHLTLLQAGLTAYAFFCSLFLTITTLRKTALKGSSHRKEQNDVNILHRQADQNHQGEGGEGGRLVPWPAYRSTVYIYIETFSSPNIEALCMRYALYHVNLLRYIQATHKKPSCLNISAKSPSMTHSATIL